MKWRWTTFNCFHYDAFEIGDISELIRVEAVFLICQTLSLRRHSGGSTEYLDSFFCDSTSNDLVALTLSNGLEDMISFWWNFYVRSLELVATEIMTKIQSLVNEAT